VDGGPDRAGALRESCGRTGPERSPGRSREPVPPTEIGIPQGPGIRELSATPNVLQGRATPEDVPLRTQATVGDMHGRHRGVAGSMINMDVRTKHTKMRLSERVTPRQVARLDDSVLASRAKDIVDRNRDATR